MARSRALLIAAALALLASCGSEGAPSAQENREMDEAERMLDEAADNLADIDENMLLEANRADAGEPEPASGGDDR